MSVQDPFSLRCETRSGPIVMKSPVSSTDFGHIIAKTAAKLGTASAAGAGFVPFELAGTDSGAEHPPAATSKTVRDIFMHAPTQCACRRMAVRGRVLSGRSLAVGTRTMRLGFPRFRGHSSGAIMREGVFDSEEEAWAFSAEFKAEAVSPRLGGRLGTSVGSPRWAKKRWTLSGFFMRAINTSRSLHFGHSRRSTASVRIPSRSSASGVEHVAKERLAPSRVERSGLRRGVQREAVQSGANRLVEADGARSERRDRATTEDLPEAPDPRRQTRRVAASSFLSLSSMASLPRRRRYHPPDGALEHLADLARLQMPERLPQELALHRAIRSIEEGDV